MSTLCSSAPRAGETMIAVECLFRTSGWIHTGAKMEYICHKI